MLGFIAGMAVAPVKHMPMRRPKRTEVEARPPFDALPRVRTPSALRSPGFLEVALAVFSYVLYKMMRFAVLNVVVRLHLAVSGRRQTRWRYLCREELRRPFALPVLMSTGPRWNVHAVVAFVGPLVARQTLRIHAGAATRSARSWSIVVHAAPGHRRVLTTVGSEAGADVEWKEIAVPPGRYWLTARYYRWAEDAELPRVLVDGDEAVAARPVPRTANQFYETLAERGNAFYALAQYYVPVLLRLSDVFPDSFVRREYLPAGNPRTTFRYGVVERGDRLQLDIGPRVLREHAVFLCIYDRASFPVLWTEIDDVHYVTPPALSRGTYLVRAHPASNDAEPVASGGIRILRVCAASDPRGLREGGA